MILEVAIEAAEAFKPAFARNIEHTRVFGLKLVHRGLDFEFGLKLLRRNTDKLLEQMAELRFRKAALFGQMGNAQARIFLNQVYRFGNSFIHFWRWRKHCRAFARMIEAAQASANGLEEPGNALAAIAFAALNFINYGSHQLVEVRIVRLPDQFGEILFAGQFLPVSRAKIEKVPEVFHADSAFGPVIDAGANRYHVARFIRMDAVADNKGSASAQAHTEFENIVAVQAADRLLRVAVRY